MSTELMEMTVSATSERAGERRAVPRGVLALLLAVLGLAALTGCGGPAEEGEASGGDGSAGEINARRVLDAEGGLRGADPGLQQDRRGQGREVHAVLRRVGRPGARRRARACRPTSSRCRSRPTWTSSSSPAWSRRTGRTTRTRASSPTPSWSSPSARATRRTSRPGTTWSRTGVEVITPNPFTSGGAKWNLMAAYGAQIEQGKSPEEALGYLKKLLQNTPVQDKSAREALATFAGGKGDVLISYENEAITAQRADVDLDYVIPDETILIQNPAAVTTEAKSPDKAKAFLEFLKTPEAQEIYASKGYRLDPARPGRRVEVPDPDEAVQDRQVRRLGQGQRRLLRPGDAAPWRRSNRTWVSPPPSDTQLVPELTARRPRGRRVRAPARRRRRARRAGRPAGRRRVRTGPLVVGGLSVAWLTLIVLIPLAAVVVQLLRRRRAASSVTRSRTARRSRPCG